MTFELLLLICNDPPLDKYGYFLESHINVFSVVCQFGHPGALSQDVRLVFLRRWNKATGLLVFNNVNNIHLMILQKGQMTMMELSQMTRLAHLLIQVFP